MNVSCIKSASLQGSLKSSKVENFLRKNGCYMSRCYESCVILSPGGAPMIRYVILLTDTIIITENPPKSILKKLKFQQIENVKLDNDCGNVFIRGKNYNEYNCKRITLSWKEEANKNKTSEPSSKKVQEEVKTKNLWKQDDAHSILSETLSYSSGGSFKSISTLGYNPLTHIVEKDENELLPMAIRKIFDPAFLSENYKTVISDVAGLIESERSKRNDLGEMAEHEKSDEVGQRMKCEELIIIVYSNGTLLIKELFLNWNRAKLRLLYELDSTIHLDQVGTEEEVKATNQSMRAAQKVLNKLTQDWSPVLLLSNRSILWSKYSSLEIACKLITFYKCLEKYSQLRQLCWQSWSIVSSLVAVLDFLSRDLDHADWSDGRKLEEKISCYILSTECIRLVVENCNLSPILEGAQSDRQSPESFLISSGDYHNYSSEGGSKVNFFQKLTKLCVQSTVIFSQNGYSRNDQINRLKMIAMSCSTCLVDEVINIFQYFPGNRVHMLLWKDLEVDHCEQFLRHCLFVVLQYFQQPKGLCNGRQLHILYRYLRALKMLAVSIVNVKSFLHSSFLEEFRYIIRPNMLSKKTNIKSIDDQLYMISQELHDTVATPE